MSALAGLVKKKVRKNEVRLIVSQKEKQNKRLIRLQPVVSGSGQARMVLGERRWHRRGARQFVRI